MSNIVIKELEAAGHDVKAIFIKEEPALMALLKQAGSVLDPVWKTFVGKVVASTVVDAATVAASGGSTISVDAMAKGILSSLETAGVAAEGQSITALTGMAAADVEGVAAKAGITIPTAAAAAAPIPAA